MKDNSFVLTILFVVGRFDHVKYLKITDINYTSKIVHSLKAMEDSIDIKTPDLVILDYDIIKTMWDRDIVKVSANDKKVSIILLVENQRQASIGLDMGVADFFIKPIIPDLLSQRIKTHIKPIQDLKLSTSANIKIMRQLKDASRELIRLQSGIIGVLAEAIEFRDFDTESHNIRTQSYVEILIRKMLDIPNKYLREMSLWNVNDHILSSQLHDIGKIGIPDEILLKKEPLTQEEYNKIKEHVIIGERIIDKILNKSGKNTNLEIARRYISGHHEQWSGRGYPRGLLGTDIPLEGRILAVVDVYDALTSVRPYKQAENHSDAVATINAGSGIQFDPEIVRIFNIVAPQFKKMLKR